MALELPDHWIWDLWLARDGADWHVFYLHAPKALGDPELRHRSARIGHGVSGDLRLWEILPDPLPMVHHGAWDDLANWTGSVIRAGDQWWMFYTGVSTADDGKVQRIGAAVSDDLSSWEKVDGNPLVEADECWYEKLDLDVWHEEAWRDPWVFPDPSNSGYHMYLTARLGTGTAATRGVIGHAVSDDLVSWEVRRPVTEAGTFGHMEVPQQVTIANRHYLLFCVTAWAQPGNREPLTGTAYLVAESHLGPFRRGPTPFVFADRNGSLHAAKVVETDEGWVVLATEHHDPDGEYVGRISDPMPLVVGDDGSLSVPSRQ